MRAIYACYICVRPIDERGDHTSVSAYVGAGGAPFHRPATALSPRVFRERSRADGSFERPPPALGPGIAVQLPALLDEPDELVTVSVFVLTE